MERVYLDNAATTKVLPEVVEAMLPYYTEAVKNFRWDYILNERLIRYVEDE